MKAKACMTLKADREMARRIRLQATSRGCSEEYVVQRILCEAVALTGSPAIECAQEQGAQGPTGPNRFRLSGEIVVRLREAAEIQMTSPGAMVRRLMVEALQDQQPPLFPVMQVGA